jgi:hypothetical protein
MIGPRFSIKAGAPIGFVEEFNRVTDPQRHSR